MKGHGEKLSRKQEQAIAALLTYPTIEQAAKAVGVGETTLWRWLQDEDFQELYRQAKREVVSQAITRLQQASCEAVEALREIINNAEAPAHARVSAAKAVLEAAQKGVENEDLAQRIKALERALLKERGACNA